MSDVPLKALGLEEQWPRLAELQDEVGDLDKRQQETVAEVQQLRAQLDPAREKDLDVEAEAVRSGKKAPAPVSEQKVKAKLEGAERNQRVLAKALEAARQDMAVLIGQHQTELFEDVAAVRSEIAAKVAKSAREALAGFVQWSDMHYTLKRLAPPAGSVEGSVPALDSLTLIGAVTTQGSGPARGDVEQTLHYFISLASTDDERSGTNAA
jgi:cell division protein FtsB